MHPALLLRVIGCENGHIPYVQLLRHGVDHDLVHSRQIVDECSEETHRCQLQSKAKAFAGFAEFERDLIRERTSAGRQAAKQRGVKFGRPQKLNKEQQTLALRLLKEQLSPSLDDAPDVLDWLRFRFGYRFNMNTLHIQGELVTPHNQDITLLRPIIHRSCG